MRLEDFAATISRVGSYILLPPPSAISLCLLHKRAEADLHKVKPVHVHGAWGDVTLLLR